jgi:gamma-glutamyltranspeptidase / glutathione hydrolase
MSKYLKRIQGPMVGQKVVMLFGLIFLANCHSTPPTQSYQSTSGSAVNDVSVPTNAVGPSSEFLSESHLDHAKFGRTNDCCAASGKKIAVASSGNNAAKIAVEIYGQGGNAVDAAVAAAFAVVVERGYAVGLGGGGFITLHLADFKDAGDYFVDFRETAPRHSTANMFLDSKGKPDSKLSQIGGLAVGIPGLVAGLFEVHKKWGKLPWKKILQPVIKLAKEGYLIAPISVSRLEAKKEDLIKDPYLAKLYFHADKTPLKVGDRVVQKDLAQTLQLIANQGKKAFYAGPIAKKMVDAVKKRGGILDLEDLKNYQVKFREPLTVKFKNYVMVSAPPPSSGGFVAAETLAVLDRYDLKKLSADPALYSQVLTETFKRAYADRSLNIGDPDFLKPDYQKLLAPDYLDAAKKSIQPGKVTPSAQLKPGEFLKPRTGGTANVDIIDSAGNAVAVTISGNGPFGACLGVPGTGILMNDTMDDFTLKVGESNMWGVVAANDGNIVAPGKRPLSSMMPTIVLMADTKIPVLAVGGAGGSRIITTVVQTVLNDLFLFSGDVKRAVTAPRVHNQWLPDQLEIESGYSTLTQDRLKKMGYELVVNRPFPPVVDAVAQDIATQQLTSAFDPRDEGGAEAK